MPDLVTWIQAHQNLLEGMGILSIVMFVGTLIVFPLVIIYLPKDYFVRHEREPAHQKRRHPIAWLAVTIIKNVLGVVLVAAGIAMLVLPGQGLLTILIGATLTNFPGKYAAERWLVGKPAVARALNRIRDRARRPRLDLPEDL
jgi:hypothetical protein